MINMEYAILTEDEFNNFEKDHIYGNFYQTSKWATLKSKYGWSYSYVGIKDNGNIIGGALILKKSVFKGINIMYSPRGFLVDYNNSDLLKLFTKELKKYAKKNGAIFVKIDPYVIYKERDNFGNIIDKGIDNSKVSDELIKLGYKYKSSGRLQPNLAFALSLKDKSIDEIFNNMEPTTRKMIRKNEKMGIYNREIDKNELKLFTDIMNNTSERREFIDRPYEYYLNMMETFKDDMKIMVAEINLKNYINNLEEEIEINNKEIILKEKEIKENKKINIEKTNNIIKELHNVIAGLEKRLIKGRELYKEKGEVLVLGSIMYLLHNKEILSLFGGAYGEYIDFMSTYTTNWNMIKYAKENGFEKYNFYGISTYTDKNDKMYGLYDFKRGFGGHVEEYLGEYDLVISKLLYFVYSTLYNKIYLKLKSKSIKKSSN